MDAVETLKTRRSVRKFLDKSIPKEIIEDIINCARLAPSANNIQPWEFVVATEESTRKKLSEICDHGKFIKDAPVCIVVFCKNTKYYLEDGSAATQNILIACHSYGLGACWVAGDKKHYAEEIRKLLSVPRKLLSVPDDYKLISLIPVGYPFENPKPRKRKLDEVIHWEKF